MAVRDDDPVEVVEAVMAAVAGSPADAAICLAASWVATLVLLDLPDRDAVLSRISAFNAVVTEVCLAQLDRAEEDLA